MNPALRHTASTRHGTAAALIAFIVWGLSPLYFRAVGAVPPFEIVAHRILWSLVFLAAILAFVPASGGFASVWTLRRQPRLIGLLVLTALLTGSNWMLFLWTIDAGRLIEASLGYFINPLVSVLLGWLFLGERLRPLQRVALAVAAAGVAWRVWQVGSPPWIPLLLAGSFGVYGLLRKRAPVDAIGGLFIETAITAPLAIAWLAWLAHQGTLAFGTSRFIDAMLPLAGVVTAIPLALFAFGAKRLPLATVGFLQFIAPSINFLLAVLVFREPFDSGQLIGFVMIWIALAIYSVDMLRSARAGAVAAT
jgi:chloramphenicol-sensitive protein RarD